MKAVRAEQSDLIVVLLNLAYVPDYVIQKIPDFKAGWNIKFRDAVADFKADFEQRTGNKWDFQNGELEERYLDFIKDKQPKAEPLTDD